MNQSRLEENFPAPKNAPKTWYSKDLNELNKLPDYQQEMQFEKNIVVLKNKGNLLPFGNLDKKIIHFAIGGNSESFENTAKLFADFDTSIRIQNNFSVKDNLIEIESADYVILSIHADAEAGKETKINPEYAKMIEDFPHSKPLIICVFGDGDFLSTLSHAHIHNIVYAPENHEIAQNAVAQLIFGAIPATGALKQTFGHFKEGHGIQFPSNGRLKFTQPEEVGINADALKKIDEIALNGIAVKAYPGCQIVVAVEDKIIYRKCFGTTNYAENADKIQHEHLYDIASVTKIAASTLMAMHLHSKLQFDLNKTLGHYLPDLTSKTPYADITIKEMMAHQAGFTPWIAFYKNAVGKDNNLRPSVYSTVKKDGFTLQVAEGIYIKDSYVDSMFQQIVKTPLGPKKYEYSDLCFYFVQKIVEKQIKEKQNMYLRNNIYRPMGLRRATYLPLDFFPKSWITPTAEEKGFRNQLLQGFVHDQGAAMLGGVGGHAGLFCNATDLASIMQLFLRKGEYAGLKFFDEKTIDEFTKQQFTGNKRGAGFDRPSAAGGGTCDKLASQQSFGHSGFTGTLAWADPKDKVIFVFLSNRVHPDPDNWKLRDMSIRTNIQHVIYEAINARK
jgi:CubicO group peptidase (beta-lactamase class C family)